LNQLEFLNNKVPEKQIRKILEKYSHKDMSDATKFTNVSCTTGAGITKLLVSNAKRKSAEIIDINM
jgi:hypothetical protein